MINLLPPSSFQALLLVTLATLSIVFLVDGTLLLYLNRLQYTTHTDASFYVISTAIGLLLRAPANLLLGLLASRYGSTNTLSTTFLIIFIGLLSLLFANFSKAFFLVAYILYTLISAGRVLRISLISDLVDEQKRTASMALHQLMTPLANLIGPLIWLVIQKWQGSVKLVNGIVIIDRFVLNYSFCALLVIGMYVVCTRFIVVGNHNPHEGEEQLMEDLNNEEGRNDGTTSMEEVENENLSSMMMQNRPTFMFYFIVIIVGRATTATYDVAFQAILVDVFFVSDAEFGRINIYVGIIAMCFPLLMTFLSKHVKDCHIIMIGLLLKVIGMVSYLPIFGSVKKWQIIIGNILIVKTMIYQTAMMSSFTKLVPGDKAAMIGYLYAASNGMAALVQFLLSPFLLKIFGGWGFMVLTLPGFTTLLIITWPSNWRKLSSEAVENVQIESEQVKM